MDKYITIVVDPGQKIFAVEKQVFLTANEEGLVRLNVSDLIVEYPKSILGFEKEIQTLLTEDQQYTLFEFFGKSKGITITGLSCALDISKVEAKHILSLGIKNKILVTGWNNTWKVFEKSIRDRMLERGRNRFAEEKRNVTPETFEEQMERMRKKGLLSSNEGEEGIVSSSVASGKVTPVTLKRELTNTKAVASTITNLKKELAALEKKLSETKDNEWNEEETPHTVIDKINKLKNELRTLEPGASIATHTSHTKVPLTKKSLPQKLPTRKYKPG